MEERYRGSHRERKVKREIGLGDRKRDRSGREREPQKKRHGGREEDRKRDREWKRERERERESHIEGEERQG